MSAQDELQSLGFVHAGAIVPVDFGRSCRVDCRSGTVGFLVYAHVVGDRVKKIGTTAPTVKARMAQNASTINQVLRLADGDSISTALWHHRPLDAFKRLAPSVIRANQRIDWWVLTSTECAYKNLERQLNALFDTVRGGWTTRLG